MASGRARKAELLLRDVIGSDRIHEANVTVMVQDLHITFSFKAQRHIGQC